MGHSIEQAVNIAKIPNSIWTFYFLIIPYLLHPRMNLLVNFTVLIDLLLAIRFQNCFSYNRLALTVSSHWSYLHVCALRHFKWLITCECNFTGTFCSFLSTDCRPTSSLNTVKEHRLQPFLLTSQPCGIKVKALFLVMILTHRLRNARRWDVGRAPSENCFYRG